jgi:membrane-associated phospholipid phosphatase
MKNRFAGGTLAAVIAFLATFATAGAGIPVALAAQPNNVVIAWNQTMLTTFTTAAVPPPAANRLGAIVQSAVFDAVNGIENRYTPIHVQPGAPDEADPHAAVAGAAYETLVKLFPAQKAALDAALASSMGAPQDDGDAGSVAAGLAWGESVGDQTLAWRSADGFSATPPPYTFSSTPGQYQPTPGGSGPPKFRSLATTTPFALTSPSQFRPAGPPALTSERYTASFKEVKALGGLTSTSRTAYQAQTATFWQVDTPTGQWDRVADYLAMQNHMNLMASARLLARVNIAIADSTIAVFDAKNAYNFWRPATAIVQADTDGNPNTISDATWLPLLTTPYFQEYPSAHSGISSAAATALASVFGPNAEFTVTSVGLPGVTRSFNSFSDAVAQVGDARILAGFHFRFSVEDGIALGSSVGAYVDANVLRPKHD